MNALRLFLCGTALVGGTFLFTACVAGGGGGYGDAEVYYGAGDERPWFHDDVWLNGSRGYHETNHYHNGGDVYINPPRVSRPATPPRRESSHPAPASHPAPSPSRPTGNDHEHSH